MVVGIILVCVITCHTAQVLSKQDNARVPLWVALGLVYLEALTAIICTVRTHVTRTPFVTPRTRTHVPILASRTRCTLRAHLRHRARAARHACAHAAHALVRWRTTVRRHTNSRRRSPGSTSF